MWGQEEGGIAKKECKDVGLSCGCFWFSDRLLLLDQVEQKEKDLLRHGKASVNE